MVAKVKVSFVSHGDIVIGLLRFAFLVALTGVTLCSRAQDTCASSAEEAATLFVARSAQDAPRAAELVQPSNLKQFRARLQQLLDNRYSPDSPEFRARFLGPEWTQERLAFASDKELVSQYLGAGEHLRKGWRVRNLRVIASKDNAFAGKEMEISYQVETPNGTSNQQRELSAFNERGCWLVKMPNESWVRLDDVSNALKRSRPELLPNRQGPSRLPLKVAAASETPRPGMQQMLYNKGRPVWVDTVALLTDADIVGAHALWDCEGVGFEPEGAAIRLIFSSDGSAKLRKWSEANVGSMLSIVLDGNVMVFARVMSTLTSRLTICLRESSLEEAQQRAADLISAAQ